MNLPVEEVDGVNPNVRMTIVATKSIMSIPLNSLNDYGKISVCVCKGLKCKILDSVNK